MDAQILIDEQSGDEAGVHKIDLKKLKDFFSASDLEWLPKNCKKNNKHGYPKEVKNE